MQYEYRGSVNDGQCVYVGLGTPTNTLWRATWYTILKRLFMMAGIQVENFDETIPNKNTTPAWYINIQYWKSISDTTITESAYTHDYTVGKKTYSDMVVEIIGKLATDLTTSRNVPQWYKVELYSGTTVDPRQEFMATLPLSEVTMNMVFKGGLSMQNVTQSSGGTGDAKLSTDRIDVNPIKGRGYLKYGGNAILPRTRDEANVATYVALLADRDTGLFSTTSAALAGAFTSSSTLMGGNFYKPPAPSTLEPGLRTNSSTLEPGEIKKARFTWKYKGKFQRFVETIFNQVEDNTSNTYVKNGAFMLYAFEHSLCQATESNVTLDYQSDFTLDTRCYYKKLSTLPVVRIQ